METPASLQLPTGSIIPRIIFQCKKKEQRFCWFFSLLAARPAVHPGGNHPRFSLISEAWRKRSCTEGIRRSIFFFILFCLLLRVIDGDGRTVGFSLGREGKAYLDGRGADNAGSHAMVF